MTNPTPDDQPDVATQVAEAELRDQHVGPDAAADRIAHQATRGVVASTDRPDRAR